MSIPPNLITGRTAQLPGDYKKHPTNNSAERSKWELAFLRLWQSMVPGLPEPKRNYRFHPARKWEIDLAWPDVRLAVEIDGGAPGGGRHNRRGGFNRDAEKSRALVEWRLLRFTGDDLRQRPIQCVEEVANVLRRLLGG